MPDTHAKVVESISFRGVELPADAASKRLAFVGPVAATAVDAAGKPIAGAATIPAQSYLGEVGAPIKVGKLTHGDLGQLQLYVNYYDREKRNAGDNPTLGLILCTDKNDAVVKYTLGADQEKTIFASRYKLHLPSEAELKAEVRRELKQITSLKSS